MKVLIDTNVLVSAALNAQSIAFQSYVKAVTYPNQGLISEQTIHELKNVFQAKFPDRLDALDNFLSSALSSLETVDVPKEETAEERFVRDASDRPILRSAVKAKADVLLTGDKDFLESGIKRPAVMSPSEFLKY